MADVPAAAKQPAKVSAPPLPGLNSLVTLVAMVVTVAGLYLAREVLIPITLAVLLSFVLAPLVGLLRRIHVPNVPSVLLAVALGLGVLGATGGVIGLQVASLATDVPQYASTIESKVSNLRGATLGRLNTVTRTVTQQVAKTVAPSSPEATAALPGAQKPVPVQVQPASLGPLELAKTVLEPVLAPFESALIIFIVAVFILMQKEDLRDRLADQGKSGLNIEGREGLRRLLSDVTSSATDFSVVLVYDVSRWGRFQDADDGERELRRQQRLEPRSARSSPTTTSAPSCGRRG